MCNPDLGLLTAVDGEYGLGIREMDGDYNIIVRPWRLTAKGHDFAVGLSKPNILDQIRTQFQEEGLSVVVDIVRKLATAQATKHLGE